MGTLIGGIALITAVILIVSGKARILAKGFINLFVDDLAKTPKGAEAVYDQAIEEEQNKYNIASDNLQLAAGQLRTAEENLEVTKKRYTDIDAKCNLLAKAGKYDEVSILAEEMPLLEQEMEDLVKTIHQLTQIRDEAQGLLVFHEKTLIKLKKEKTQTINNLKRNIQVKQMYDQMDELKKTSNATKLLGVVKENAQQKQEMATGARTVHESKLATRVTKAENVAGSLGTSDYVSQLKAKYNSNNHDIKKQINKNQL